MAVFKINQPIVQPDPVIKVDASRNDPLPIGANRFRLVVVDNDGNESDATFIDALNKGEMNGTILQDPVNMGYLGVKTAVAKLKGEKIEAVIDTGATLVTKDNMADPKTAALIKSQLP